MTGPTGKLLKIRMKRIGQTGIAVGVLAVVACELPLLLAVAGLAGFGSGLSVFSLPPVIEMIGITIGFGGIMIIAGLLIRRAICKVKT